ncbi:MAG: hypothetical protein WC100_22160 [Sterolibacterium sp.]
MSIHFTRGYLLFLAVLANSAAMAADHSNHGHGTHAASRPSAVKDNLPPIRIVSPNAGAQLGPNLAMDFETDADLPNMTMGGKSSDVHLHVNIDDTALMPTMSELKPLGKNQYRYLFDMPAAPGQHLISVYWSDAAHRTIEHSVRRVSVTVVPKKEKSKP